MNVKQLYDTNKDFKGYVDRYSKKYNEGHSISTDEALTHAMVHNKAKEFEEN